MAKLMEKVYKKFLRWHLQHRDIDHGQRGPVLALLHLLLPRGHLLPELCLLPGKRFTNFTKFMFTS
jgi:hypothetical protein